MQMGTFQPVNSYKPTTINKTKQDITFVEHFITVVTHINLFSGNIIYNII